MNKYPMLFSPIRLANMTIKNRIVMSPMETHFSGLAGDLSPQYIAYIGARARGGAGLIVTEGISPNSKIGVPLAPTCVDTLWNATTFHDLAEICHVYDCRIIVQLEVQGLDYSADPIEQAIKANKAFTGEQIKKLMESYVNAALYLQKAGIDGVQIQAGGGYFINQFLSPLTNFREDEYNGDLRSRSRILTDALSFIRQACGSNFIVCPRIPSHDYVEGGLSLEDGVEIARLCEQAGADYIDVLGGFAWGDEFFEIEEREQAQRLKFTKKIKEAVNIPVNTNGKIKDFQLAEDIIEKGEADLINFGRPFLADANWPNKIRFGNTEDVRPCLSCNECIDRVTSTFGTLRCTMNPFLGHEQFIDELAIPTVGKPLRIIVVGAGPAGMQTAIIASKRGHDVIVLEKDEEPGGQLNLACKPPFKGDIAKARDWMIGELRKSGAEIRLSFEATAENIKAMNPDRVVIATGATPFQAPIAGVENTVPFSDALNGLHDMTEKDVIIIGGGIVGIETARYMAELGNRVTVLEMLPDYGRGMETFHKLALPEFLEKAGIDIKVSVKTSKIAPGMVGYTDSEGNSITQHADLVIMSTGQKSVGQELKEELLNDGIQTHIIGDAKSVGKIGTANKHGLLLGYNIA